MLAERVAGEAELLRLLFLAVDRADERAALGGEHGLRVLGVAELAAAVGVAAGLEHATRGVDGVEAMLGVGGERAAERLELRDDDVAALVGLVLEDRERRGFDRARRSRCARRGARARGPSGRCRRWPSRGCASSCFQCRPSMRREQVGRALDERDERAHRDRHAALGEVAADAVERREQPELLVDEPREPLARDLRALVGRGQRARRRALAARAAATRGATHDAAALVLLDDVQLLFDDLVDHVERGARRSARTRVGAARALRLRDGSVRLAPAWARAFVFGCALRRLLGQRFGRSSKARSRLALERRRCDGRLLGRGLSVLALRDREQLRHALVELARAR